MPNEEKALSKIRGKLAHMSMVSREMFDDAYKALVNHDHDSGKAVILRDATADTLETELTEMCLSFLALYAPKAHDLRYVVAVTKIASDLERIADHSTAMGRRVLSSHLSPLILAYPLFREMVALASNMLERATESLFHLKTCDYEDFMLDINNMKEKRSILEKNLVENLGKDPEVGLQTVHFLEVARRVSRVSGHARNIVVMVPYITEGKLIRHNPENSEDNNANTTY
jgi:phosphate transport system protein